MPPVDALTEQSLRDYGLVGTLLILGVIFAIVHLWKRPPPEPHASPMEAVKENAKLIPFVLEEIRQGNRLVKDLVDRMEGSGKRLERLEHEMGIVKDRLTR